MSVHRVARSDTWSSAELMDAARVDVGLSDFGEDSFREGLDIFLESAARDRGLVGKGVDAVRDLVVRRLRNRLEIEEWYRQHAGIGRLRVDRPIFITGLPRTGTSALANLLSLDDQFRPMRWWEQEPACPPPILAQEASDPRRLAMAARLRDMQDHDPQQMTMHLYELDSATEDPALLGLEFKEQMATVPAFAYLEWWRTCDMQPAYEYHRRALKLLQSRRPPNRWLIKAPHHIFHLEAIVDVYPDARFLVTHRDPVNAIPSWSSLVSSLYPPGSLEQVGAPRVGRELAHHQVVGMERAITARGRMEPDRFLDIQHGDFSRDAFGTIERVYAFLGMDLDDRVRDRMHRWTTTNRPGAHGRHRYTPEQFGLSADRLREDFEFYTTAYQIPLEASP